MYMRKSVTNYSTPNRKEIFKTLIVYNNNN